MANNSIACPQVRITQFDEGQMNSAAFLSLPAGEVHLWLICIQAFEARSKELGEFLNEAEIDRMQRFRFPGDRLRFVVTHGILRLCIGRYLELSPRLVGFRSGCNGKPELHGYCGEAEISFNISHSHNLAVLGFTKFRSLGVDVEHIRPIQDFYEIVSHYFHPRERVALQSLSPGERHKAFFAYWTCKEAFVKATGEGLSRSLDSFFISPVGGNEKRILTPGGDGIRPARWKIISFRPARDYAGAVAFAV
ncbi:4'-phosphopantetheinyl transferase superfamily protein [Sporomusa aerivorans]|uniref:4'-phosphopantetheinyl transferase family protein n=1 Tax=Sporomusa aerivorans TaxID=204936 RepID=UPI00352B3A03